MNYDNELKHFHDFEMEKTDIDEIAYRTGLSRFTITSYLNGNGKDADVEAQIYATTEQIKYERSRRDIGGEFVNKESE
jgi:hypothetical protein